METVEKLREAPHFSYTSLNTYLQSPMKYAFRYIELAPVERVGASFPFGRAFHAVLSARAINGASFSLDDGRDCFAEVFKAETDAAPQLTSELWSNNRPLGNVCAQGPFLSLLLLAPKQREETGAVEKLYFSASGIF